jgi:hypothetical protein
VEGIFRWKFANLLTYKLSEEGDLMGMELLMLSTMASIYGIHMWLCAELCTPSVVPTGPFRRPRLTPDAERYEQTLRRWELRMRMGYGRQRFEKSPVKVDWKNEGF